MKKYVISSLWAIVILVFSNCQPDKVEPSSNNINFENLAVGQKSLYVRWESFRAFDDKDTTFKATTDTVFLLIESKDDAGFKVKEEHLNKKIASRFYYFKIKNDTLYVKSADENNEIGSILFNFGKLSYPLKDNGLEKLTLNRWAFPQSLNTNELFGKTGEFTVMGKTYSDAFAYYNGLPIIADGPMITRIYTKKDGFITFHALGGLIPFGSIYMLLP